MAAAVQHQSEPLGRETILALAALSLGVFIVTNDLTALSVAIPKMESALHSDPTTSQWAINGYALSFGVLMITCGRLADVFGRKRLFVAGALVFGISSFLGGLAQTMPELIAGRVAMGVGAAMMWPAMLGMMYVLLPVDRAGLAGGLVLGIAGIGNSVGPLIGGFCSDTLTWRWVFFINVPIAILAIVGVARCAPEARVDAGERRLDYFGVLCLSVAIVTALVALDQGATTGFGDPIIIMLFLLSITTLVVFAVVEMQQGDRALIPRDVSSNRRFLSACSARLLLSAIYFSVIFFVPAYLVKVLGFSAMEAGLALLPMMATLGISSFLGGPLYNRVGAKLIASAGAAAIALGMIDLSLLDARSSYWELVPGLVLLGAGCGFFYSSVTTAAITALEPARASLAGGIVYMIQIAGGAVGLGVNTAIVTAFATLPTGIAWAFRIDAGLAVLGTLVCVFFVGGRVAPHAAHRGALHWRHSAHA